MPIPDLTPIPGGVMHATGTGEPINGNNTFKLGIDAQFVNEDWLQFFVIAQGPSVTAASFVSYDPTTGDVVLAVTQGGTDQVRVDAQIIYSPAR